MKIKEALFQAREQLKNNKINSYQIDSLILLCFTLDLSKEQVIFYPDLNINIKHLKKFLSLIDRRSKGEPVSHIIGKREFFGRDFIVNSSVLDPRPDSETLVETVLSIFDQKQQLNILELGIGSGCLILTIIANLANSTGIGVDISDKALEIATENSKLLNLENRVTFIKSDWFSNLKEQKFDLIISNPPYIPNKEIKNLQKEVKDYEPRIALDGGIDGLNCYKKIAANITDFLKDDAILILEIGQNQKNQIKEIFENKGLKLISTKKDLGKIIRCLIFKNE